MSVDVSLHARFGEFVLAAAFTAPRGITALYGPSGSGKTLTLRCVAGLETPTAGHIVLGGRVLLDRAAGIAVPTRDRRIGYVFQQYALFPHLDVAGNLAYGLRGLKPESRQARVSELLALVGLTGYGRRRPRELSGGEQQRVALARALATRPELLLLDEPFSALDFRVRQRLRAELQRIHESTATPMLLVTHDLREVKQLADTVVLFDRGRVLRAGPIAEVLAEPGSRDAALLLAGDAE